MRAIEVVARFVTALNTHDVDGMLAELSPDHVFTDAAGVEVRGMTALEQAWRGYLVLVPDYRVEIDELLDADPTVVLFGVAGGSFAPLGGDARWRTPAAWRGEVRDGRLASWRVWADNEPIRRLMRRALRSG